MTKSEVKELGFEPPGVRSKMLLCSRVFLGGSKRERRNREGFFASGESPRDFNLTCSKSSRGSAAEKTTGIAC